MRKSVFEHMQTVWLQISLRIRAVSSESYTVRFYVKQSRIDSSANNVALRSDCVDAQVDLELHSPHMMTLFRMTRYILNINLAILFF